MGIFGFFRGTGYDFTTKIWDMNKFEIVYQYEKPLGAQYSFDISQDSSFIIISGGSLLFLLNSHWTTTGINEPTKQSYHILYPNPAGNEIVIPFEPELIPIKVTISNTTGQVENK